MISADSSLETSADGHFKRYLELPSKIFLDLGKKFSFSIIMTVFDDISDINSLRLSFTLSNSTFVTVNTFRRVQRETNSIIYDIDIIDNGMAEKGVPGGNFAITSLIMNPQESSFECIYKSNAVIDPFIKNRFI